MLGARMMAAASHAAGTSANWWEVDGQTCVAAYQPIGALSLEDSYINLANPGTYNLVELVAPVFDTSYGWEFDGTQYLSSGIIPGTNRNMSTFVRITDVVKTYAHAPFGVINFSGDFTGFHVEIWDGYGDVVWYVNGRYYDAIGGTTAIAPNTMYVIGIAGNKAYLNGSPEPGTIPSSETNIANDIWVGDGNSRGYGFKGKIAALAVFSTTLTGDDVATLTTRMAALS